MKKTALITLIIMGIALFFSLSKTQGKTIGVVVPIEHQALTDITKGFVEVIRNQYGPDIEVIIQNAQGDGSIQNAIIDSFKRRDVDLIVTLGTDVTLMAQSLVKNQPILGLDVTEMVRQNQDNITGVLESPIDPSYHFIRELIPQLKKVTMVYSASDKNIEMTRKFSELAKEDQILVQPIMIHSLADLYTLASSVDADSDAIFIAKDHLVASGTPSLAQTAKKLQIPLITSDEGSIKAGGAAAFGNKEIDIGRRGGEIAVRILEGESPHNIPIRPVDAYTLFVNAKASKSQGLEIRNTEMAAKALNSPIEFVILENKP